MAYQYLREHREELMPEARETIERWILAGQFGKRAQRALAQEQCAKIKTNAQTKEHCSNKQIPVQMSGAE